MSLLVYVVNAYTGAPDMLIEAVDNSHDYVRITVRPEDIPTYSASAAVSYGMQAYSSLASCSYAMETGVGK